MSQYNLIAEAERLWLKLNNERARAEADMAIDRELRISRTSERAFWRLIRRLGLESKAVRMGLKKGGA